MSGGATVPGSGGAWARLLSESRRAWLALSVLAVALAAAGLPRLELVTDHRVFFSPDDPQLRALTAFEQTYSRSDSVLFVVAPRDGDVFSTASLETIRWLTDRAWRLPGARRVDSLANFQHSRADGDTVIVAPLVGADDPIDGRTAERVRRVALAEPMLVDRLVARAGDVAGVNVRITLGPGAGAGMEEVAAAARALARSAASRPDAPEVRLTGNVMLNAAFPEASISDLRTLVPVMYVVIAVVMALLLGSVRASAVVLVLVGMSAVTAMGLAGWLGIPITAASADAPTIIMTIAVADAVHVITGHQREIGAGLRPAEAMRRSLLQHRAPVTLTSFTTLVGFLSLNFSDSPPFHGLGNITALGVVAAFVFTFTALPGLAVGGPLRLAAPRRAPWAWSASRVADWVIRRRRAVLLVSVVTVAGALIVLPRLVLNDQFVDYFDERVPFRRDTDFAMERLTGIYRIHYSLPAGAPDGVNDPRYLQRVAGFANWLRQQPGVVHVQSVVELLERLNRNMHGDDPAWTRLPETRELAAQLLLLYQLSVPYGLDLNDSIDVKASASRITVTLGNLDNDSLEALVARSDAWLAARSPPGLAASAVGTPIIFARLAERNIVSMLEGGALAMLVIAATLVVTLRDLRLGLLSLLPNLVPAMVSFGIWTLLVGEMGLALSVVTAMTLGIVVDDTVHLLCHYRRARRSLGMAPDDAVRHAFSRAGRALVSTSAILVAGFGVLATSSFAVNQGLGELTALIIAVALVADFTLLPALLSSARPTLAAR